MARYWVGGTGNWDASTTTPWSDASGGAGGFSVPTSTDDVIFDSASNATAYTVTLTATANCANLTIGNPLAGVVTFGGSSALNIYGNLSTASGALLSGQTLGPTMCATSGTKTITTNGVNFNRFGFNGSGGTFQLSDGLTINGSNSLYRTAGTFTANGQMVTLSSTSMGVIDAFTGSNAFYNLTVTGPVSKTGLFTLLANIEVTNTLTINGNNAVNRLLVSSGSPGTARTITSATNSISNADFQDITGAGAASWNLSAITGNSGDCGGNSSITFTTPATQHWLNASSSSWSTASNWTSRVPLPQDDVVMDKAFGTSQTVTADMPRLGKSIDWTGATWTTALTLSRTATQSCFGSFTLISGLTVSGASTFKMEGRGSYTLTTYGISIPGDVDIIMPGNTLTLGDNLTIGSGNRLFVRSGTVTVSANDYTISSGGISTIGGTLTLGSGTHTITGVVANPWNMSSGTLNANTSTIKFTDTSNTAITFVGGTQTYNNVWFSRGASTGDITIRGSNTFADFKDDGSAAHSILFTVATTQTFVTPAGWKVSGTVGNLITINSTTTGTHALIASGSGNVSADYLNIQHSVATPAATWYAGANSTNNQATATAGSGWIFTAAPTDYIIAADHGSLILSGQDAGLLIGYMLGVTQGSYTLSGVSAGLFYDYLLAATQGSYTLSGADSGFLAAYTFDVALGQFTLSGFDVGILNNPRLPTIPTMSLRPDSLPRGIVRMSIPPLAVDGERLVHIKKVYNPQPVLSPDGIISPTWQ